jgi:undecaprenyl-diphosphatase
MEFYAKVLVLALIQGAAELLPVSSSAHVILAQRALGMDPSRPQQVFLLVMLHTGTMFAVIVYFWRRWQRLLGGSAQADAPARRRHFLAMIVLATACTGCVGWLLKEFIERVILVARPGEPKGEIEELFKNLPVIAAALAAVGVFIVLAGMRESAAQGDRLTVQATVWVGLVQALCVPFRGFSRSGATISTGLVCGVSRSLAEDFSFALAVVLTPAAQAYSFYKLVKGKGLSTETMVAELLPGLVGMLFSFAAGLLALRFLSAVLEKGRWAYFGLYCLLFAGVVFWAASRGM